jgi:hypothetical protein
MIKKFIQENAVLLLIAAGAFVIQFLTNVTGAYGYFRDELYYIACSKHLAWGYVDEPPFSILLLAINRFLLGDSLTALRFLPAASNAIVVLLAGLLAKELGGKTFAQAVAAIATLIAPVYLTIFNFYSMNSFDILFWALSFYIVVRIIKTGNEKLWLIFGVVAGLGLENKYSLLFLCAGIVAGMILTQHRKQFLSKYFWMGAFIAILLFMPHNLWEIKNGWPSLEFMRNATLQKNAPVSPVEFFIQQILMMNPFNVLIWIPGLLYLFLSASANRFRLFAFAYAAIFLVFVAQHGKPYYLSPFYTMLFAAGAVAAEKFFEARSWEIARPALVSVLLIAGVMSAPFALPVLPVETFIRYARALGMTPHSDERDRPGRLDQHYADMFGWKEMAETVASVYEKLPANEKASCGIFGQNYGEAGAIDFFGEKYGLPKAMSGHNNYWLWGPTAANPEVTIVIGGDPQDNLQVFQECHQSAVIRNPYARSFETDLPVSVCRGLKQPFNKIWPQLREYI